MAKLDRWFPIIFIFIAVAVAIAFVVLSAIRDMTNIETAAFQSFSLIAGLIGSYIYGKRSAKESASEMLKPHARSAFRRLISLYRSLSRVATEVQACNSDSDSRTKEMALSRIEAIVTEQIATAGDALHDWHDIVPNEVEGLRARLIDEGRTVEVSDE